MTQADLFPPSMYIALQTLSRHHPLGHWHCLSLHNRAKQPLRSQTKSKLTRIRLRQLAYSWFKLDSIRICLPIVKTCLSRLGLSSLRSLLLTSFLRALRRERRNERQGLSAREIHSRSISDQTDKAIDALPTFISTNVLSPLLVCALWPPDTSKTLQLALWPASSLLHTDISLRGEVLSKKVSFWPEDWLSLDCRKPAESGVFGKGG
jgi:hypothetical protein